MPRRIPGAEIELLVRVKSEEAKKRLIEIEKTIKGLKPTTQRAVQGVAAALGFFYGKLTTVQKWLKHFGQTLKSAVFRTIAYGIINTWIRKPLAELKKALKELEDLLQPTERAAVMMAEGGKETSKVYKKLLQNIFSLRRNIAAAPKDISLMHQQFAKGGVRNIDIVNRWSDVLTKAGAITGENIHTMVRQFIQLKTALGITDEQFEDMVKLTTIGTTMSMGTLQDLAGSVSRLAQTYNLLYANAKDPLQVLKDYVAVNMAVTKAGVKGVQVGTWMSTMMYRLLNPTKKMIDVMSRFGFQVYEAPTRQAESLLKRMIDLAETSDKLREKHSKLVKEESKLRVLQEKGVDVGDKLTKVTEERLDIESRLRRINELQRASFKEFIAAGGRVKLLNEIFQELHRRVKENTMTANELVMLIEEAFGVRFGRGVAAGSAQAESMRKIFENLDYSIETFDKEWSQLLKLPATQINIAKTSAQKLRD
ncbi:MAG: phage tail tape measure protein, partial [Thermoprotei archaeon]